MKRIITIGRQYYADGSKIAKKLSEITGIACYDRESLAVIAEKNGISREMFDKADEQATSSFMYSLALSSFSGNFVHYGPNENIITDRVFNIQSEEIRSIASDGEGIFVGRCADDILSDEPDIIKVYIHAPIEKRISDYIADHPDTDESQARKIITKADKKRASYYNFYTGKGWGDPKNYHVNIDSSALGVEGTAQLIKTFAELKWGIK